MKKIICILICAIILSNLCISVYSSGLNAEDNMEYYNKAYDDYVKGLEDLPEDEYNAKMSMAPSKYSYNEKYVNDEASGISARGATYYSKTYDSIKDIPITYKDVGISQYSNYLGWSFAANDALEIYLKKRGLGGKECEFSEQHMLVATSNAVVGRQYASRGNFWVTGDFSIASAYWMRNELNGPTKGLEYNYEKENKYSEIKNMEKEPYYVTDTIELSDLSPYSSEEEIEDRINSIKSMIVNYGSVFMQYDHFDGAFDPFYNAYNNNNWGEIQNGRNVLSGVVIVGWDDDYAISNFGESKPDKPGAFKVVTNRRKEKSDGTFQIGSYYISYNMLPYFMGCSAVKQAYAGPYSRYTYEYDKKAHMGVAKSNTTTNVYANKYKNNYGENQKIKSVTTFCEVPGSYFNIYFSDDGSMENLKKINATYTSSKGYLVNNMGYVTLDVNETIEIEHDSEFLVAIEVITPTKNAESIPQEVSPVDDTSISGRCFKANSVNDMINGNYEDCGSRNNIIKVHVNSGDREWRFDDSSFDGVKNSNVKNDTTINGLTIKGSTQFSNSLRLFTGVKMNNFAYMYKSTDRNKNSLKFYVNGPSKIYVIGKSNDETKTRRLAVYLEATGETEYINMDKAKGYCYTYYGDAGYIYLYSADDTIRIYEAAAEDFDTEDEPYTTQKKWDFSDLYSDIQPINNMRFIKSNIEYNGLYLYSDGVKNMEVMQHECTSNYGHRYFYALDLDGSGTDKYRTIGFDVGLDTEIYITAKSTGTDTRKLYVTNKYYCEPETDIEGDGLNITSNIETYKIHYTGDGERIYLRSADEGIRILKIEVRTRWNNSADEYPFEPSNIDELIVGSYITSKKTVSGYTITGTPNRAAAIVASSVPNYTKAIRLVAGEHFGKTSKIEFKIGSSDGSITTRPNRKIRVLAKASDTSERLILCDEFGCIVGAYYNMSTDLKEYTFDYKDTYKTLYLYIFDNGMQGTAEIYGIYKSDIDYYADAKTLTITKDADGNGECIISVDNVPDLSMYRFKLEYDKNVITYTGFEKISSNNNAIASSNFSAFNAGTYIYLTPSYSTKKYNWSGIIGKVRFKFVGNNNGANVKLSMEKYR